MKELIEAGYELVTVGEEINGLLIAVEAFEGGGKTHFGFTGPGPIAYLDIDKSDRGVSQKFISKKKIWRTRIYVPAPKIMPINAKSVTQAEQDALQTEAAEEWEKLKQAVRAGYRHSGTVVIDTESETWELIRLARFGMATKNEPYYGPVNAEYLELFKDEALRYGKNVIFLRHLNQYKGDIYPKGFGGLGDVCDIILRAYRDEDGDFCMKIMKARQNPTLVGTELTGTDMVPGPEKGLIEISCTSFPYIAKLAYPESKLEDWL